MKSGIVQVDGVDYRWSIYRQPSWTSEGLVGMAASIISPSTSSNITRTATIGSPGYGRSAGTLFSEEKTNRDRRELDRMIHPKAVRTNTTSRTAEITYEC